MQEQLLRKARQKDAITAMEEERKRRIAEDDPYHRTTDEQALVLEEVERKVRFCVNTCSAERTPLHDLCLKCHAGKHHGS